MLPAVAVDRRKGDRLVVACERTARPAPLIGVDPVGRGRHNLAVADAAG